MLTQRIYILGEKHLTIKALKLLDNLNHELIELPYSFPTDKLDFLGEAQLIFVNLETEQEEEGLNKIYPLRKHFPNTPIILIALEKQLSITQIVQSWRDGVTDYLIPPFGNEELSTILRYYLESNDEKKPLFSFLSLFGLGKEVGFLPSTVKIQPSLIVNEQESDLFIHFFGVLRLTNHGKKVQTPKGTRLKSVLAYLLYHKKTAIHRDKFQRRFWHDFSIDSGRNNLNVTVTHIRRHFQPILNFEIIVFQNDCFSINHNPNIQTDVHLFIQYFEQAKQLERVGDSKGAVAGYKSAIEMYKSDFLEDLWHEEWTIPIREELQEKYIAALDYVSSNQIENKQFGEAIESLRQILSKDDCWEEAHRKLMFCYVECGKIDRAIRQYQECEKVLKQKLEVAPSKATIELFKRLKSYIHQA
jgi:DNA-binding SARP family transcriptional activator